MQKVTVYRQSRGNLVAVRDSGEGVRIKLKMGEEVFSVEAETAEAVSEAARKEAASRGLSNVAGL